MARKQRRGKNCGDRERGREQEEEKKELTQNWLGLAKNKELGQTETNNQDIKDFSYRDV